MLLDIIRPNKGGFMKSVTSFFSFRRKFIVGIIVAVFLVGSISAIAIARVQTTSLIPNNTYFPSSNQGYYFGPLKQNSTLYMQIEQYKRQGPMKETIESNKELFMFPETAIINGKVEIDIDGSFKNIYETVSSLTGEIWYTLFSADANKLQVNNPRAKQQFQLTYAGEKQIPTVDIYPNYLNILPENGWDISGESSYNQRDTVIFKMVKPIGKAQEVPLEGEFVSPVTYDLTGEYLHLEMQVDKLSGAVLQSSTYVINNLGEETLVERISLIMSYLNESTSK